MNLAIEVLNQAGHTWWSYVFPLTWTSSLVAAILLAVIWIGRRWPAQLRYAIILVALIKFAVPPTLTSPVGLFSWFGPPIIQRIEPSTLSDQPMDSEADNSTWTTILSAWGQLNWHAQLMLLHATGMVLAGSWAVLRLLQLVGMAHRSKRLAGGKWFNLLTRLSKQFGLNRPVSLLVSSEAVPPMAFGLLRPYVMVPMSVLQELPARQIKTMLAHELAHHKRADPWINALQNILGILWWFNPLFRLLNRAIRRVREDCCDDMLLCRNIATDSRYCQILLHVASNLSRSARMIAAMGFATTTHPLGRRIKRIMDPKVYRWARLSFGTAASIAILAALLLPGLQSERPTTSSADTPSVLEVLAPSEPQAVASLAEKSPTNTQDQTWELAASFPQHIEDLQLRNYPTVKPLSNIAVAWADPAAFKTAYSTYSPNQDEGAHDTIIAIGNSDFVKKQKYRLDDLSKSAPLLSRFFPEYGGGSDRDGGSGYVALDTRASGVFASRQVVATPPMNMTAISFVQNSSESYSFHSSMLEMLRPINNNVDATDLAATLEWPGPLGLFDPAIPSQTPEPTEPSVVSQPPLHVAGPAIVSASSLGSPSLNTITDALDLDTTESSALDDAEVLAMIDSADSFDLIYSSEEAGQIASSTIASISKSQIESSGRHRFEVAWTNGATDTADVVDSVDLAYNDDVPSFIDFANVLLQKSPNSSLITFSRSDLNGRSAFGVTSSYLNSSSYTTATIPEPMTIWLLLAGSLVLMYRREKGLQSPFEQGRTLRKV